MAKIDWQMNEVVQPADLNQIGQEINELADEIEGAAAAIPDSLVKRDAQGRAKIANPTADDEIANKGSVEAAINTAITNLVNGAPAALDTLLELATALGNDPNFATTMTNALTAKINKAGDTLTGLLALPGDPTLDSHSVRKRYVDDKFGAKTTEGTWDWNDVTNTKPGAGQTLLRGNVANGPVNTIAYFYPFNFEYSTKTGSGNITQLAIPYALTEPGTGIYMRTRFGGVWTGWQRLLTNSDVRINSGDLEFFDGTGWKSVGKSKVSVASDNVRLQVAEEVMIPNNQSYVLLAKFIPEALGEVKVSCEVQQRFASNTVVSPVINMAMTRKIGNNHTLYDAWYGGESGIPMYDYSTPLGTVVSSVVGGTRLIQPNTPQQYDTYFSYQGRFYVHSLEPIYLFGTLSGATATNLPIRNLKIMYDLVGG
ncbi:pyocin knob domain-containing protein [Cohnella phaseoli]|uniref:Tail fiber-like repeat protein n=1 Tax=Cohnella phaseoli TaxID=456490 RepID=A0A3D9IUV6_9BACL|nr:pyocin knob domain-containing protein [Cohnella phaseoli]RED65465.1 hypothetical protein DFP98_119105 [Cohnella phaseoli]